MPRHAKSTRSGSTKRSTRLLNMIKSLVTWKKSEAEPERSAPMPTTAPRPTPSCGLDNHRSGNLPARYRPYGARGHRATYDEDLYIPSHGQDYLPNNSYRGVDLPSKPARSRQVEQPLANSINYPTQGPSDHNHQDRSSNDLGIASSWLQERNDERERWADPNRRQRNYPVSHIASEWEGHIFGNSGISPPRPLNPTLMQPQPQRPFRFNWSLRESVVSELPADEDALQPRRGTIKKTSIRISMDVPSYMLDLGGTILESLPEPAPLAGLSEQTSRSTPKISAALFEPFQEPVTAFVRFGKTTPQPERLSAKRKDLRFDELPAPVVGIVAEASTDVSLRGVDCSEPLGSDSEDAACNEDNESPGECSSYVSGGSYYPRFWENRPYPMGDVITKGER
ncbi:hypothetical protein NA57DRAFT_51329 [Rhizodiscina lignyota]|uniref:Uncharacterized protein n=1 Tax=Rhizodiscina lignyota TaxID=1504668 RepID=A0A9P4IR24_9PEZI|nr:hypothetical protein NA57DRAFT_51329 [Rhizodiscina lignyota]